MAVKWSQAEAARVEETLRSDGYRLLLEYLAYHEARLIDALARPQTSWEDTNRFRGELAGLRRFHPSQIQQELPDNPIR